MLSRFFDAAFSRYAATSALATTTDFALAASLHALGATVAHVLALRDDSAGALLYPAIGFAVTGKIYAWEKNC